ncbi:uncharacterized protein RAG0_02117 [Rhynchosporium agropyri]|uniref:Secreted protein n=1 Tax=Rhynchosporium agropyri TaxID=914238 RepID=A0A1E1K0C8_9HELO|nr:uncharacterized protein RAG0_02117 [Rhynchosporium agropyri]
MGGLAGWLVLCLSHLISGKLTLETASFVASTQVGRTPPCAAFCALIQQSGISKINHERAPLPALNTNHPSVRVDMPRLFVACMRMLDGLLVAAAPVR